MEMDRESALMLIQLYESHPLLWNPKHMGYFNKTKKMNAWQEIADCCNISIEDAKRKMSSLLGSYRREKKKGVNTIGTGKGGTKIYKSDWYAIKYFEFLMDKDETTITSQSTKRSTMAETETQSEDDDIDPIDTTLFYPHESMDDNSSTQFEKPTIVASNGQTTVRNNSSSLEEPRKETAFKMIQQRVRSDNTTTTFANYIAEKLNQFDPRTKSILVHDINNLIFRAEMKLYSPAEKLTCGSTSSHSVQSSDCSEILTPTTVLHTKSSQQQDTCTSVPLLTPTVVESLNADANFSYQGTYNETLQVPLSNEPSNETESCQVNCRETVVEPTSGNTYQAF